MSANLEAFFDASWYCSRYPDVQKTGMQPLQHYQRYGERLGRKPGPAFDPLFYGESYPDVIDAGVSPFTHFVTFGKEEGRRGHATSVQDYTQQLWRREHIADCLAALVSFTNSTQPKHVRNASWTLARWFAWHEDWHATAHWLDIYYQYSEPKNCWPVVQLLYIEALSRVGDLSNAQLKAEDLNKRFPSYFDAYLAISNVLLSAMSCDSSVHSTTNTDLINKQRLQAINKLFYHHGLQAICFESSHFSLETLFYRNDSSVVDNKDEQPTSSELVSVILPVFNGELFLTTALRSIAAQTHFAIEVLIVDDASTDRTVSVAQDFIDKDTRFKLLRLPSNQGAYAARNLGLKHATGDYITIHDADDWSHPNKIATQLKGFKDNPHWLANTSDMVRCTSDLRFGRWRLPNSPMSGWIYRNTSSLMFKRTVYEQLGYWDVVRCSADTEYIHRIIAAFGEGSYGEVMKGVPLSFCRHLPSSLSQVGPFHLITQEKGLRRDYLRAAKEWHESATKPNDLYMPYQPEKRLFISPKLNLITKTF